MSDGKRCKCITNRWRTLECIQNALKCILTQISLSLFFPKTVTFDVIAIRATFFIKRLKVNYAIIIWKTSKVFHISVVRSISTPIITVDPNLSQELDVSSIW